MSWIDWLIVIVPVGGVMFLGFYVSKYVVGVADFLVGGRLCHRYLIANGDIAAALGLVVLAAYVEVQYQTGFALSFWHSLAVPLSIAMALSGYCIYRFRQSRAMSIGQFLEMRYSRKLRIFACFLRSIAEMMANMIMPAIAARFFICYLGLPAEIKIASFSIPTFAVIVMITLALAISLICCGGTLSIVITDTLQGIIFFPTILIFIVFVLTKFSWNEEIVHVLSDRIPGESFIDPFDISELRDFNIFMLFTTFCAMIMHRASGLSGSNNAAISAHEAKMATILGTWRSSFANVFFVIITLGIITIMSHANYADDAKIIRTDISRNIARELLPDEAARQNFMDSVAEIPPNDHAIGIDPPFSQRSNPDEIYFHNAQKNFGTDGEGSAKTQQYKTLFRQLMLPAAMRQMLPVGLTGLFCMMILLFIISTDDSRIYSASSTLVQDCVVPFYSNGELPPEKHIKYIRYISIGVGVFFFTGSLAMSQIDYINLFISIMYGMWLGGCGPMIIFGLYSRFGTTAGAWSSLLTGMGINLSGVLLQRNWAEHIYPFLERHGMVEAVGNFLSAVSRPFDPYIVWEMNKLKFPINSYEIYFLAMFMSLMVYIVVSRLTVKEPFNLDRMLHRGEYAVEKTPPPEKTKWSFSNIFSRIIGITPEYTRGDRVIAWSVFFYSIVYQFILSFIGVIIWNIFYHWPASWWGYYFLIVFMIIPGIAALITSIWFSCGGIRDLFRIFKDLKERTADLSDNGIVESTSEKIRVSATEIDHRSRK